MLDNSVTINADSVEEAISKGLLQLGIKEENADIRIISEGKKGFLGFGKQEAIVAISRKNHPSLSEMTEKLEKKFQYELEQATEVIEETLSEKVEHEVSQPKVPKEIKERIQDLEESNTFVVPTTPVFNPSKDLPSPNTDEGGETEEAWDNQNKVTAEKDSEVDDEFNCQHQLELHKASQIVADFLVDIIREYGAQADVDVEQEGNQLIFNIDTDKSGLIIGKHGKIINSLQVLAQTFLHHHYRHRANVTLNVGDYRNRRANVLEQMAQRTAEEVLRTKQAAILDSLPAYERKQIHAYLSKIEHIRTHSEGKDPNRYLVVEFIND